MPRPRGCQMTRARVAMKMSRAVNMKTDYWGGEGLKD